MANVLRVFAVWVLLDGLAVVPRAFFERELTIGHLIAPEIARGIVIAALSVGLAWWGWGYWSFIVGDLAGAALLAGYSWWKAWGKIPLKYEPEQLPGLLRGRTLHARSGNWGCPGGPRPALRSCRKRLTHVG